MGRACWCHWIDLGSLISQDIQPFSMSDSGGHFEVMACVPTPIYLINYF
jgi:hypothetical protein